MWLCLKGTGSGVENVSPVHHRLTVFAPGTRVDFSIHSTDMLDQIVQTDPPPGPNWYTLGYEILVDKDCRTHGMAPPFSRAMVYERPSEDDFHQTIEDFWHEAHNVAKYLARSDLWSVKFRDWEMKRFLLPMIEWHAHSKYGRQYDTGHLGKRMSSWVDREIWQSLHGAFARFNAEDSRDALIVTIKLFQRIAPETAERLGYGYLDNVDSNIGGLITTIVKR